MEIWDCYDDKELEVLQDFKLPTIAPKKGDGICMFVSDRYYSQFNLCKTLAELYSKEYRGVVAVEPYKQVSLWRRWLPIQKTERWLAYEAGISINRAREVIADIPTSKFEKINPLMKWNLLETREIYSRWLPPLSERRRF